MKEKPEVVDKHLCELGESPIYDHLNHRILWVDILQGEIHQLNTLSFKKRIIKTGQFVGAVNLCSTGELLAALHKDFAFIRESGENLEKHMVFNSDIKPNTRFNDAKCDPAGNLWAGTMDLKGKQEGGKLVMLDRDLQVSEKIPGVSVSNGMAWSSDHNTFYYIDSRERSVVAYDYDLFSFEISGKREIIKVPEKMGLPDGMTIDEEGMLWIAMWKGGKVTRWDPSTGKCILTVLLPVSQVTSCTFGGKDFEDLYITSARTGLTEMELKEEPLAGSLFILRNLNTRGLPPNKFKTNPDLITSWQAF